MCKEGRVGGSLEAVGWGKVVTGLIGVSRRGWDVVVQMMMPLIGEGKLPYLKNRTRLNH